jgi:predicted ribosomally synthesized peptide with nif11-like leader
VSKEAAQAFIEKMKSDEAFRAKVTAGEDVAAKMAIITGEGFDCSAEEIGAVQELGDAELDGVAGGKPDPGSGAGDWPGPWSG